MYFANRSSLIYLGYSTHKEVNTFLKDFYVKGEITELQDERFGSLITGSTVGGIEKTIFVPRYSYFDHYLFLDARSWKSPDVGLGKKKKLYQGKATPIKKFNPVHIVEGKGLGYSIQGADFHYPNDYEETPRYTKTTWTLHNEYRDYFCVFSRYNVISPRVTGGTFFTFLLHYFLRLNVLGSIDSIQRYYGSYFLLLMLKSFKFMPKRSLLFITPFYLMICRNYSRRLLLSQSSGGAAANFGVLCVFSVHDSFIEDIYDNFFLFFLLFGYSLALNLLKRKRKSKLLISKLDTKVGFFTPVINRYHELNPRPHFLPSIKKIN